MYEAGDKIVNPEDDYESFVFAGYDRHGQERWCAVVMAPWGKKVLAVPETVTFEGFVGDEAKWSRSAEPTEEPAHDVVNVTSENSNGPCRLEDRRNPSGQVQARPDAAPKSE